MRTTLACQLELEKEDPGLSFVPFQSPSRPTRRRVLDRDQIVNAGLELLSDVGLDGVTMRHLAERLGVKAASLYRHVKDKAELLVLLGDALSARAADVDERLPWRDRVIANVNAYRAVLRGIRDGARLLAETPPAGPNRLKKIDAMLGAMLASGCAPREAAEAAYHLNNLVVGFVADEERADDWTRRSGMSAADVAKWKRAFVQSLASDEYPNLAPMAEMIATDDPEATFAFGINLLLDGLEARVTKRRGSKPRRINS